MIITKKIIIILKIKIKTTKSIVLKKLEEDQEVKVIDHIIEKVEKEVDRKKEEFKNIIRKDLDRGQDKKKMTIIGTKMSIIKEEVIKNIVKIALIKNNITIKLLLIIVEMIAINKIDKVKISTEKNNI